MLEFLKELDTQWFLAVNQNHTPFFDWLMWWASNKFIWIPLYATVLFFFFRKYKQAAIFFTIFIIIAVALADLSSVHLFKNVFQRLRPCREEELRSIILLINNKCGGLYGFVSSHAANCFAFATFSALVFKNKFYTLGILLWAGLVAYSRVYLGVHYPGDIICGGLLGSLLGFASWRMGNTFYKLKRNIKKATEFFSLAQQIKIIETIQEAEKRTSGEIRVHLENHCSGDTIERAKEIFKLLEIQNTEQNNGVLIYLAVADKKFAILGDKGIDKATPPNFWDSIKKNMANHFSNNEFLEGTIEAINEIGVNLAKHFPCQNDDINELSDEISFYNN